MARLSEGARLFFIGTWCLADDAGYFVWDVEQIGATLYAYDSPKLRVRHITRYGQSLMEAGCLVLFECGHAKVPTLPKHQRLSGPTRRVETHLKNHRDHHCPHVPDNPRTSPHVPDPVKGTGNRVKGTVKGTVVSAQAREDGLSTEGVTT